MFFKTKSSLPPRRGWVKVTLAVLGVLVLGGTLVAFRASSAKKEEKKTAEVVLEFAPADITVVDNRELARTLLFSGSLSPVVQSAVKSKVSGDVKAILVREGQTVAQGQALAQIDTADIQARLDAAVAAQEETRARLTIADKNRETNLQLLKQNFISQNAYDTTQSTADASAASMRSAEAQVRIARNALQDAVIRAPINGIVSKKMVTVGEKVGPDSPMFSVVDLARMEIEVPAPASEIPSIHVGQTATFTVDGFVERSFDGKVERINPVTEMGSRSITVYVAVANRDGLLKGGMFAKGSMVLDKSAPAPVVPVTAVREEAGQSYVFTIEDGKVARRPVTLGMREEKAGLVEIKSGVGKGAKVVSARVDNLKAGAAAIVKTGSAKEPAKEDAKEKTKDNAVEPAAAVKAG